MSKDNIVEAGKIINEYITKGNAIMLKYEYNTKLIPLVDKDVLMALGCRFVEGYRSYMELPYDLITDSKINATALLYGD